jgi:alginate O-acetyltransferase complex protein AlgI
LAEVLVIFTEHRFFIFFAIVFAVFWALRTNRLRKVFLLVASYVFYGVWDWRFISLLLISTLVDFFASRRIEASDLPKVRKGWLMLSLVINLGMLGVFKYLGFLLDSTAEFLGFLGFDVSLPTLAVVLPIGISFYTFQSLSYTIDVYLGKESSKRSFLDVALFVGFFPQLVAGPIVRSREFLPQLAKTAKWSAIPVRGMLWLFMVGYFKKACISDNIFPLVDAYYENVAEHTRASGVLASMFFAVQLYCDFSGYSDMAIACAGLLGYTLPMNFYYPLLATDYTKLMNRWHMSLSRWVRDYIYLPMVGKKRSSVYQLWCLTVTMFLMGLWHGAAWHFVIWGLCMGLGAAVHRVWQGVPLSKRLDSRPLKFVGFLITYSWVVLVLILFRAENMGHAWEVLRGIGGPSNNGTESFGSLAWGFLGLITLAHYLFMICKPEQAIKRIPSWSFAVLMGVLVPLCLSFARADVKPFIYFQF